MYLDVSIETDNQSIDLRHLAVTCVQLWGDRISFAFSWSSSTSCGQNFWQPGNIPSSVCTLYLRYLFRSRRKQEVARCCWLRSYSCSPGQPGTTAGRRSVGQRCTPQMPQCLRLCCATSTKLTSSPVPAITGRKIVFPASVFRVGF